MAIFATGFEPTDPPFDEILGSPEIQSVVVYSGNYALKCNAKGQGVVKRYSTLTAVKNKFRLYLGSHAPEGGFFLFKLRTQSGIEIAWLGLTPSGGQTKLYLYSYIPTEDLRAGSHLLDLNRWYEVTIKFIGDINGGYRIELDGIEDVTRTGINTSSVSAAETQIGQLWSATPIDLYFDDASIESIMPYPPTVDFSLDKAPHMNETVTATATVLIPGWDGTQQTTIADEDFLWNFGDGTPPQTGQIVQHTFPKAQTYLVTLTVTDSAGQSVTVERSVTVVISGPYYSWFVGFDKPEDAVFPKPDPTQGIIQQYPFQAESSWFSAQLTTVKIERVPSPMGLGTALRMAFIAPEPFSYERIHIRHLWNPKTDSDIWLEATYYVPPTWRWVPRQWVEFHCAVSERIWDAYNNPIDSFALGISFLQDLVNPDGTYPLQTLLNFLIQGVEPSYIRTHQGIDLDKPFKIKSHVHRPVDVADPTLETAGGYLEVWINDVKATWYDATTKEELGDRVYCRTCGVHPDEIMALPTTVVAGNFRRGWVESGIDFYSGSNDPNIGILNNEMFFDDVTLATLQPEILLTATFQGYVKDKAGTPIVGATVTCDGYADITKVDGSYAFVDIPAKAYTLTATMTGYQPVSIVVDASTGGTYSIDLELTPVTPPKPCFVATVAYGSPLAGELNVLRRFRDYCLPNQVTIAYYAVGPFLAQFIKRRNTIKRYVREVFDLMVKMVEWVK